MNLVFCMFGVLSVIITVSGDRPPHVHTPIRAPFYFGFRYGESLNVKIHFYNSSPDVIYTMYEEEYETPTKNKFFLGNIKRIEDDYIIQKRTLKEKILIFLELKTNDRWCANITIIEAISIDKPRETGYDYNKACLSLTEQCVINMDLNHFRPGARYVRCDQPLVTNKTIMKETSAVPVIRDDNLNSNTSLMPTTSTESADILTKSSQSNVIIYVIPAVIVMFVLILMIYMSVKKYCHRHPVETMELNTYTTANQVVYADLSLVHGNSQPPKRDYESPYAQVIGVMKPVENVQKK